MGFTHCLSPHTSNVKPLNMSLRRTSLTALVVAGVVTLFAVWLTSGQSSPAGGKPLFIRALVVLPFVVAAKNGIEGAWSLAFAFVAYYAV